MLLRSFLCFFFISLLKSIDTKIAFFNLCIMKSALEEVCKLSKKQILVRGLIVSIRATSDMNSAIYSYDK
jgi:hypothetical protein